MTRVALAARGCLVVTLLCASRTVTAQSPRSTGSEISALPALNFDADEGFGYGLILHYYDYGTGVEPYRFTVQPIVFLTTRGRRDANLFFDAPHLLPAQWRLSAYVAREQQLATPYYGVGNETVNEPALSEGANPYYYRFGRTGVRLSLTAQRPLTRGLRFLVGAGVRTSSVITVPFDSGTTLLAQQYPGGVPKGVAPFVRGGLIYDSRDREIGTEHGTWAEVLEQHTARVAGGNLRFDRVTGAVREFVSPTPRLTIAERVVVQQVSGDAPFYELYPIQGSLTDFDGLGGNSSVRGWPKDRFAGKGLFIWNNEVRWRAATFDVRDRRSTVVVTGFADAGRVWSDRVHADQLLSGLHAGYGGGLRFAYGQSFVVATDVAHSRESAAAIYIGLGYMF